MRNTIHMCELVNLMDLKITMLCLIYKFLSINIHFQGQSVKPCVFAAQMNHPAQFSSVPRKRNICTFCVATKAPPNAIITRTEKQTFNWSLKQVQHSIIYCEICVIYKEVNLNWYHVQNRSHLHRGACPGTQIPK